MKQLTAIVTYEDSMVKEYPITQITWGYNGIIEVIRIEILRDSFLFYSDLKNPGQFLNTHHNVKARIK